MRRLLPVTLLYLLTFGFCVALVTLPSCGGSQRQKTLRAAIVATNVARDGFTGWDGDHQKAIVDKAASREEGERELAAYRAKREPIVARFEAAYRFLALAATQSDDPSLREALKASGDLLDAIKTLIGGP
jgi:hypothetical protein